MARRSASLLCENFSQSNLIFRSLIFFVHFVKDSVQFISLKSGQTLLKCFSRLFRNIFRDKCEI